MNVAVVTGGDERELTLDLDPEGGTVGDLMAVIADGDRWAGLLVDGRFVGAETSVATAGIRQGSVLVPANGPSTDSAATGVVELRVIGGLTAATRTPLPSGSHTIGPRGADVHLASPTVSPRHAQLDVSSDGTAPV